MDHSLISTQLFPHLMSEWNTKIVDTSYPSYYLATQICQSFTNSLFVRQHQFQIQSLGALTDYGVVFMQAIKSSPVSNVKYLIDVVRGDDRALDYICQNWMGQDWSVVGPVMGILITHHYEAMLAQVLHHIKHCNHLTVPYEYHHQWMASILFSSIRLQQQSNFDKLLTHVLRSFQPDHNEQSVFAPALRESARHLNAYAAEHTLKHMSDIEGFVEDSQKHYKMFFEHHIDWLLQWTDDQTWQDIMHMYPSLLWQEHSAQRQNDIIFNSIDNKEQQGKGKKRL